jgi:hypothetical protein
MGLPPSKSNECREGLSLMSMTSSVIKFCSGLAVAVDAEGSPRNKEKGDLIAALVFRPGL